MAAVSEAGSGPDHGDMAAIRTGLEMRPIEAADGARLRRFHSRLSARTIYLRYHAPHPDLREGELRFLVNPDPSKHVAWVACDEAGEIVGVCRVVAQDCLRSRGDIAIVVADDAQRTGVGPRCSPAFWRRPHGPASGWSTRSSCATTFPRASCSSRRPGGWTSPTPCGTSRAWWTWSSPWRRRGQRTAWR